MRKLIPFLIALQLSMVLVVGFGFHDVLAQDDVAEPNRVVVQPSAVDCGGGPAGERPTNIDQGDIVVLLTEAIESVGPEQNSCGEIIYCLRQAYSPNKETADADVINHLKSKYWNCIVTGNDGLGLLNNYAGLVYRWIAGIVGAICILMVIISGIQITMGGLSPDEVNEAKERIIRSLTGMVVLFLSAFILYTINPIFFS